MKIEEMLAQGFVKVEGQPRVYKYITDHMIAVLDDIGNGEYEFGDCIVLRGNLSPEEQIKLEHQREQQFGKIPII